MVFSCGGKLRCHKSILAQSSPVFEAMLNFPNSIESKSSEVSIKDIDLKTGSFMMEFVYTGIISNTGARDLPDFVNLFFAIMCGT